MQQRGNEEDEPEQHSQPQGDDDCCENVNAFLARDMVTHVQCDRPNYGNTDRKRSRPLKDVAVPTNHVGSVTDEQSRSGNPLHAGSVEGAALKFGAATVDAAEMRLTRNPYYRAAAVCALLAL